MNGPGEMVEVYCVHCGYDLRGIESSRCPECGEGFDRGALQTSRIPWMHRREIGRIEAWWRTVWLVTRKQHELARCMAGPVPYADARAFWIVNAVVAAGVAVVGMCVADIAPPEISLQTLWNWAAWKMEAVLPWHVVMGYMPMRIVLVACFVALAMGVQTYLAGRYGPSPQMRGRAAAIGLYGSGAWIGAGMVGTALALGLAVLLVLADLAVGGNDAVLPDQMLQVFLVLLSICLALIPTAATWNLMRHVGRLDGLRALGAAGLLVLCWAFLAGVLGAVLPWCAGLVWLMVRNL